MLSTSYAQNVDNYFYPQPYLAFISFLVYQKTSLLSSAVNDCSQTYTPVDNCYPQRWAMGISCP
ncbi:hypothetical protein BTTAP_70075 [Brochothrix thermosphacta]|uniref:Uncharacterized protein n=1 Tax=Brochothrix thermosphacta TaxID=2756 RepID=A0A2X0R862_BROTH|nr:hypothetical protein BTH160X_10004 [Brochothrix thermosphacta]SPN74278.1 hypothetical protein BTEBP_10070 [Brochothrix thermosphacta]SPP29769.1 hypothetical protein BTBSAS_60072 [Brochothrix thermosphacta]SPP30350.1 hypothetical protein BTTAP_70075 [Brochothrix thermosphacta]